MTNELYNMNFIPLNYMIRIYLLLRSQNKATTSERKNSNFFLSKFIFKVIVSLTRVTLCCFSYIHICKCSLNNNDRIPISRTVTQENKYLIVEHLFGQYTGMRYERVHSSDDPLQAVLILSFTKLAILMMISQPYVYQIWQSIIQ